MTPDPFAANPRDPRKIFWRICLLAMNIACCALLLSLPSSGRSGWLYWIALSTSAIAAILNGLIVYSRSLYGRQ